MIASAAMGDPNASIPTPQPVHYRPMFAAFGGARGPTSLTFLSGAAMQTDVAGQLNLQHSTATVKNCRNIGKADMIHNDWQPDISVDPQTYQVKADGELLECEPATSLPLAQLYQLF